MFKELNILKLFFESPTKEFNVREVARTLKINPATASTYLKKFEKIGLLKYKKQRIQDLYKANLDSDRYKDLKVYYQIRKLKESGLIESLNKFYIKPTIVLFGSCSYGMDTETSDIDLVVISEKTADFPEQKKFEKKLNREIQIFAVKDIKELRNEHLINNVMNGIIIQGEIKWI